MAAYSACTSLFRVALTPYIQYFHSGTQSWLSGGSYPELFAQLRRVQDYDVAIEGRRGKMISV